MENESTTITQGERRTYGLYFVGQNMLYLFVMNYIQNYFTDVVGITAGTVAVIILIARLCDAVNDPLFGVIVDRSRLQGGRFKPWLKLATVLVPLFTILVFSVPQNWPLSAKTWVCGGIYVVWGLIFTMCDVPIYSLVTAMTNSLKERTALIARGRLHSVLGILIVMAAAVPLTNALRGVTGAASAAWLTVAILFSVIAIFFMRPICRTAQERFVDQNSKPISLPEIFRYLCSNKYLLIFYGALIVSSLTNTMVGMSLYFTDVNLHNSNLYVLLVVASMIGSPLVSLLMPKLNKRFDKFYIYMFGLSITVIFSVVTYIAGYEGTRFIPFLILTAIRGFGVSCSTVMSYMFAADCIEYGTFRSGMRAEGVTFSIQTFTTKLTGAISGFVAMGLLGWLFHYRSSYYVNNVLVVPQQPASAAEGIWFMFSLFPAIGAAFSFVILLFLYKLRDKEVQIVADVNSGKLSREEGEKLLNERGAENEFKR